MSEQALAADNPFAKMGTQAGQSKDTVVDVYNTREMEMLDAPYQDALKKLSGEQIQKLNDFEQKYLPVVMPDVDIFDTAHKVAFCEKRLGAINKSDFENFVKKKKIKQAQLSLEFYINELKNVDFLNVEILKNHMTVYHLQEDQVFFGLGKLAYKKKPFTDNDCTETKRKIDNFIDKKEL